MQFALCVPFDRVQWQIRCGFEGFVNTKTPRSAAKQSEKKRLCFVWMKVVDSRRASLRASRFDPVNVVDPSLI